MDDKYLNRYVQLNEMGMAYANHSCEFSGLGRIVNRKMSETLQHYKHLFECCCLEFSGWFFDDEFDLSYEHNDFVEKIRERLNVSNRE